MVMVVVEVDDILNILKVKPIVFADRLDIECEKVELRTVLKFFFLD